MLSLVTPSSLSFACVVDSSHTLACHHVVVLPSCHRPRAVVLPRAIVAILRSCRQLLPHLCMSSHRPPLMLSFSLCHHRRPSLAFSTPPTPLCVITLLSSLTPLSSGQPLYCRTPSNCCLPSLFTPFDYKTVPHIVVLPRAIALVPSFSLNAILMSLR